MGTFVRKCHTPKSGFRFPKLIRWMQTISRHGVNKSLMRKGNCMIEKKTHLSADFVFRQKKIMFFSKIRPRLGVFLYPVPEISLHAHNDKGIIAI